MLPENSKMLKASFSAQVIIVHSQANLKVAGMRKGALMRESLSLSKLCPIVRVRSALHSRSNIGLHLSRYLLLAS